MIIALIAFLVILVFDFKKSLKNKTMAIFLYFSIIITLLALATFTQDDAISDNLTLWVMTLGVYGITLITRVFIYMILYLFSSKFRESKGVKDYMKSPMTKPPEEFEGLYGMSGWGEIKELDEEESKDE